MKKSNKFRSEKQTAIEVQFFHTDHLGTPIALADREGNIVWGTRRDPFGNLLEEYNPHGIEQNIGMPGQYLDRETNLYYNYHRYYDPKTCAYISQDPIGINGGSNLYVYAAARPLRHTDPRGLCLEDACIGEGLALLIGLAATSIWAALSQPSVPSTSSDSSSTDSSPTLTCPDKPKCPPCNPVKGTQCYEKNTGHPHNGWDPHYHIWTRGQNLSPCQCFWNRGSGTRGTVQFEPFGMNSCDNYSTWPLN